MTEVNDIPVGLEEGGVEVEIAPKLEKRLREALASDIDSELIAEALPQAVLVTYALLDYCARNEPNYS